MIDVQHRANPAAPHGANAEVVRSEERAVPVIEQQQFKHALGSFATGVTLATTDGGGDWHGITANAVMSVSLDPPLVALSVQQDSRMYKALRCTDNFALNILAAEQLAVARYFADSSQSHNGLAFAQFPHHIGHTGAPLLDGALAGVDCRIVAAHPAGDHTLFIGQVVHLEVAEAGSPLLYFRGVLE